METRARAIWPRFCAFVEASEARAWGPGTVAALIGAVIAVRNVAEIAVAQVPAYRPLAAFLHYPLAYVGPFLALTLVLALWARVAPARVARLMAVAWLLTLLPPLVDWLRHAHHERPTIAYLQADPVDLPYVLVRFFDPFADFVGTTPGIRIEAFAAVVLGAFYVWLRSRSVARAAASAATIYVVSLFFFCLPILVLGALRLVFPGCSREDLHRGVGLAARSVQGAAFDAAAILWLVPVVLALLWIWRRLERRGGESWFPAADRERKLPGVSSLMAGAGLAGAVAAVVTRIGPDDRVTPAPFDVLAGLGLLLCLALLARGALALGRRDWMLPLIAGAVLAAGLGRAPALAAFACAGLLVPLGLGVMSERLERVAAAPLVGLSGFAAFTAGFALLVGPEAFARMPVSLALPALAGPALYGLAALLRPPWARLGAAGLIAFAVGLAMLAVFGPRPAALATVVVGAAIALGLFADGSRRDLRWMAPFLGVALILVAGMGLLEPERTAALREEIRCHAGLLVVRGEDAANRGEDQLAAAFFRSALRCDGASVAALRGLGLVAMRAGNESIGIARLERAAALSPESIAERTNLAAAYNSAGRHEEALAALDAPFLIGRRHTGYRFNRAQALDGLERWEEALDAWARYAALAAGRPEEAEGLKLARRRLKRIERRLERQRGVDEK